ncbi:MAG: penicillin-binding protein 1C [Robiginitomaculum sp.]
MKIVSSFRVKWPLWLKWSVSAFALAAIGGNALLPPPLTRADAVSTVVTDSQGKWLSGFTVENGRWRIAPNMETLDPRFVAALITIEDKRFYGHGGVDPIAVGRASLTWAKSGRAQSGASTLTMQLVRQLEPRPRTLGSKAIESLRAAQYEMRLSKREILKHYLTHAPYGGNLEGVRAASLSYFGQEPERLTDAQIALLIALPQAPEARRPDLRPKAARAARDEILDKLEQAGFLTARQTREAKEASVPSRRLPLPENGWLTAQRLASGDTGNHQIQTTLDGNLQRRLEKLARHFVTGKDAAMNLSILVIENERNQVRASIGSAGRERPGGWIDMATRTRSPGSTLKPFIYGLAFDDGIAAPGTRILDAPTRFGSYQPENFSRRYHGKVTAAQALQHSLNVPAVAALEQVGEARFEAALRATGIKLTVPKQVGGKAGLAVALGGVGVSSEGLGVLYAGLANGGIARPLNWTENDAPTDQAYPLLSKQSAARITKILRQAPTPEGRVPPWLTKTAPPIAYKTGTSYGYRDAWAAGYTDKWTVIIWTGRADGGPLPGQTGRKSAAPLLYDVFAQLGRSETSIAYAKMDRAPKGLADIQGVVSELPVILFPPDRSEVAVSAFGETARGVSLSARSPNRSKLTWYVDGKPMAKQASSGRVIWRPDSAGFYTLSVVNALGEKAVSRVRVLTVN